MRNYPQTTAHFLLKYLQLKALELDAFEIPLETALQDLRKLQDTCGYGVYPVPDVGHGALRTDLKRLEELGFIYRVTPNPGIQLSHLGLYFAELFDTPPILEEELCKITNRPQ